MSLGSQTSHQMGSGSCGMKMCSEVVTVFGSDGRFSPFFPPACDCLREGQVDVCTGALGNADSFQEAWRSYCSGDLL